MKHARPARPRYSMRRLASLVLGVALLAAVLALTLGDGVDHPQFMTNQDKLEHGLAFLGLGFFFGWGASIAGFVLFGLALAATAFGIEAWQQSFTLTREGSIADALASLGGLSAGLLTAAIVSAAGRTIVRARRKAE